VLAPVKAEPFHVGHDAIDVFDFFLGGIRVVKAQVAAGIRRVLLREAEIEADALRVTDVEVAIRLRRETGDDLAAVATSGEVGSDHFTDEIEGGRRGGGGFGHGGRSFRACGGESSEAVQPRNTLNTRKSQIMIRLWLPCVLCIPWLTNPGSG
jgi:hypothetical protein